MFYNCKNFINIDLSFFDYKNVTNMCWMFCDCKKLNILNLSSFFVDNVINAEGIFFGCPENIRESNLHYFKKYNKNDLIKERYNEIDIFIISWEK